MRKVLGRIGKRISGLEFARHPIPGSSRSPEGDRARAQEALDDLEARFLGEGQLGKVYAEKLKFIFRNRQSGILELALKYYDQWGWESNSLEREKFENSLSMHPVARAAGLKVLPTYRFDRKNGILAMSDWTKGGRFFVSAANGNAGIVTPGPIEAIVNFAQLIDDMCREAERAGAVGIGLHADAYFFRFPSSGGTISVEYVIGDLDNVVRKANSVLNNVHAACQALKTWVHRLEIAEVLKARYEEQVDAVWDRYK